MRAGHHAEAVQGQEKLQVTLAQDQPAPPRQGSEAGTAQAAHCARACRDGNGSAIYRPAAPRIAAVYYVLGFHHLLALLCGDTRVENPVVSSGAAGRRILTRERPAVPFLPKIAGNGPVRPSRAPRPGWDGHGAQRRFAQGLDPFGRHIGVRRGQEPHANAWLARARQYHLPDRLGEQRKAQLFSPHRRPRRCARGEGNVGRQFSGIRPGLEEALTVCGAGHLPQGRGELSEHLIGTEQADAVPAALGEKCLQLRR